MAINRAMELQRLSLCSVAKWSHLLIMASDRYNSKHVFQFYIYMRSNSTFNVYRRRYITLLLTAWLYVQLPGEHCKQTQAFCSQSHNSQSNFKVLSTMNSLRVVRKVTSVAQRRNMSDIFETKNKIASVRKTFYSNPEAGKYLSVHILIFFRS